MKNILKLLKVRHGRKKKIIVLGKFKNARYDRRKQC